MDALRVSCNIFFYDLGRRLGIDTLVDYASQFGLGEPTGIELPEATGHMSSPTYSESVGEIWNPGDVLQTSIGQSKSLFTPLQLAHLHRHAGQRRRADENPPGQKREKL